MTNYNDGEWHGHNGGECPVHPKTEVEYIWKCEGNVGRHKRIAGEDESQVSPAWENQVIAFRVIREHVEPREVWMVQDDNKDWLEADALQIGAVLFREVQP